MADSSGLVRSTTPGIASRANLSVEETKHALAVFESPDEDSRSLNDEGKKIRRVDGGYEIINYLKYREIDYTAAERMKRMRALRRNVRNGANKTVTLRKQKQSTEADKEERGANGSRPQSVEDMLKGFETDKTYEGIDVRREYGKMLAWCKVRRKKPTQRRFVNWLNGAEIALPTHAARVDYKRTPLPPVREPTDEELSNARRIAQEETAKLRSELKP